MNLYNFNRLTLIVLNSSLVFGGVHRWRRVDENEKHFLKVENLMRNIWEMLRLSWGHGNRLGQVAFVNCGSADWPPIREVDTWCVQQFGWWNRPISCEINCQNVNAVAILVPLISTIFPLPTLECRPMHTLSREERTKICLRIDTIRRKLNLTTQCVRLSIFFIMNSGSAKRRIH